MSWPKALGLTLFALFMAEKYIRQPSREPADWFAFHRDGGGV